MKYIVMEIQTSDSVATIIQDYPEKPEAESRYHAILSAAAISAVPKHGAVMLTDEGERLKGECYYHVTPEPEEETDGNI